MDLYIREDFIRQIWKKKRNLYNFNCQYRTLRAMDLHLHSSQVEYDRADNVPLEFELSRLLFGLFGRVPYDLRGAEICFSVCIYVTNSQYLTNFVLNGGLLNKPKS